MSKTKVIWKSYHEPDAISRGYWDQALLEEMLSGVEFEHQTDFSNLKKKDGAVVVINGRMHTSSEDRTKINNDIEKLRWVFFIVTGDEEAQFPWRDIKHKLMKIWVQLPRLAQHDDAHGYFPNGYRPTTRALLKEIGQQERDLDWSFIGQVNHERRERCYDVLHQFQAVYPKTVVQTTKEFGKELVPYPEYLKIMAKSKIVLCPSGVESPDSFRLYEALEAGCIPVVDAFSANFKTSGFWPYLLGKDIPFPIVKYWDELPQVLPVLLRDYRIHSNRIFAWWQLKKFKVKRKLIKEIKGLSR